MDYVSGFPLTQMKHDSVWVIVDKLTKSSHFLPVRLDDECKTRLCFEFISHAIMCIWYPYSCKTHKISSKLGFVGLLMKNK